MSSAAAPIAAEQVILKALEEAVSRIAKKVSEGKRLSEREVSVLMMSTMMRRMDDLKAYVDKGFSDLKGYMDGRMNDFKAYVDMRFDAVDKRMEGLERRMDAVEGRIDVVEGRLNVVHNVVSSIKTDIIKMMRELLDRAYGERRA